jgi:ankyrin repeat protein
MHICRLLLSAAALSALLPAATPEAADLAERHDLAALRKIANLRSVVNEPQADGTTALHWAAHWNDLEMFHLLLRAGADPKAINRYGASPLSEAALRGNAAMVEALLKAGADPNTLTSRDGETVLMTAARGGNLEVVKALVSRGANVNARENFMGQTALMWAAAERHPEIVKYLLENGADGKVLSRDHETKMPRLSAASSVTPMPRGGLTALQFAAREGDIESARHLLDAGASIDQPDADGASALIIAAINKQYSFAKYLLERGADPNVADVRGRTALYAAIDMRNEDYSAMPSRKEFDPYTSLELIQLLLDRGADPNLALTRALPGRSGMDSGDTALEAGSTPLMRAARAGDVEVMRRLLAKGADPHRTTAQQKNNILTFAAGAGYRDKNTTGTEAGALEAVKLALAQGLDIHYKNARGETALHGAAHRGADSIVEYLIQQGAKIDEKSVQGFTPLDIAMGKHITTQLPVPHDSTVALIRRLGGTEGKPATPSSATVK